MGKQKYTAKEKKVSRMTRNGLVEENLATKETRKVTNSDQELPYIITTMATQPPAAIAATRLFQISRSI